MILNNNMDKNYLVTKSNFFIMNSSYDLSVEEQKIILTLASMVQPNDEHFKVYKFKVKDFINLLGIENQNKYKSVPKITKDLMKKVFEIEEEDMTLQIAWLSSAEYRKGSGYVELEFSPKLKKYLLRLNKLFTQYKLENILNMRSKYSIRIYELLKCNEFKKQGYIQIEIEELRKLLKINNIYPLYGDFKRKILIKTQKELKKVSDISFEFEEIKTGRKVTAIKFYIISKHKLTNKKENNIEKIKESNKLILDIIKICDNKIKPTEALSLSAAAEKDILIIEKAYNYSKNKNTNNLIAYMIQIIKSIKDGTFVEHNNNYNNNFNNFNGRNYSDRYFYLLEQCLNGLATKEEEDEFNSLIGKEV